jgi:hypothetical protein
MRFDPDPALVGKAEQCGICLKVFGGQPGDGVISNFGRSVENVGGNERGQACILLFRPSRKQFAAS